jgi:hypothetical protein
MNGLGIGKEYSGGAGEYAPDHINRRRSGAKKIRKPFVRANPLRKMLGWLRIDSRDSI